MAVLGPMPSASAATAASVNPRVRASVRTATRRSSQRAVMRLLAARSGPIVMARNRWLLPRRVRHAAAATVRRWDVRCHVRTRDLLSGWNLTNGNAPGEIWLYRFKTSDKRRPGLVLSRQDVIPLLHTVMVAPITS